MQNLKLILFCFKILDEVVLFNGMKFYKTKYNTQDGSNDKPYDGVLRLWQKKLLLRTNSLGLSKELFFSYRGILWRGGGKCVPKENPKSKVDLDFAFCQ